MRILQRKLYMYCGYFHIHAGLTERKEEYVVYLKEGDAVTSCLQIMGAQSALMEF